MGGFGSGRHFLQTKNKVSNGHSLDANAFTRWKYFKPGLRFGSLTWSRGGQQRGSCSFVVNIDGCDDSITFLYSYGGKPHPKVRVRLTWYHPGFGGRRYLFRCPRCGKRMRTLRLMYGEIGCRVCFDLTYESCVENNSFNSLYKYIAATHGETWEDVKKAMKAFERRALKEPKRPRGRPRKQTPAL